MSKYQKATIPALKTTYLFALADFRDPALISRAIDFAFSNDLRSQDLPGFLASLLNSFSPAVRAATWSAVKAHWADLEKEIPTAIGAITGSTGAFCDAASKKDIQDFFATHSAGAGSRGLQRSLERIDRCIAFRAAQQQSFDRAIAAIK